MEEIIAIDLGSTRTKGALFRVEEERLRPLMREEADTHPGDLEEGFSRVLEALLVRSSGKPSLAYSSSAKGGLSICAVGIVPELTLKMAKQTALSAGGKVSSHFAWKLTEEDLRTIAGERPDIILLTGGTDGGNEEYLLYNASQLAELSSLGWEGPVLFAGNRCAADRVRKILDGKELYICKNILPELDRPEPEPARGEIRRIFLQRLCEGKGLGNIIRRTGEHPLPTPSVLFDFLSLGALREGPLFPENGGGMVLFDIGGATSDCYSFGVRPPADGRVLRGLPEPDPKRSVEGDLGLRVSAQAAVAAAEAEGFFRTGRSAEEADAQAAALRAYAGRVSRETDAPPADEDRLLAEICLTHALVRHAGRMREAATASGTVFVQEGKDLTGVSAVIGTGGYLSRCAAPPALPAPPLFDRTGWELLLPGRARFFQDTDYLWPLLANAARIHPGAALRLAPEVLAERSFYES